MPYDVDKRPGTWVSRQATKRRYRVLVFTALLLAGSCVGLILKFSHHPRLAIAASALSLVFALIVWRRLDRKTREAVNWLRGARAEEAIGDLLNELRGEGFIVMHDIPQEFEGNVDHLVSGPTGVFMIESKARGYQAEALGKAKRQARKLHDELDNWVVPVICIHNRDREPFRHEKVWVVPEQHVLNWIRAQHETPVPFERLACFADTLPS